MPILAARGGYPTFQNTAEVGYPSFRNPRNFKLGTAQHEVEPKCLTAQLSPPNLFSRCLKTPQQAVAAPVKLRFFYVHKFPRCLVASQTCGRVWANTKPLWGNMPADLLRFSAPDRLLKKGDTEKYNKEGQ